jgi:iron-sulfur cluster insertion protein
MPAPILFTDSAAAKVADLIAEEGNPDLKLRVFVQGGGCSGFQYGLPLTRSRTRTTRP